MSDDVTSTSSENLSDSEQSDHRLSADILKNHIQMTIDNLNSALEAPSTEQKLFLVVSVALATLCFCTNAVQVGVFLRPSALKTVKSLLLLSQAVSGIFASFMVVFPIHVISARGGPFVGPAGFDACYLGHSGIILVALLTSLSTATLLVLNHFLTNNHPRRYLATNSSLYGWAGLILTLWIGSFGIAILPWTGWNSWVTHDARCHLSTLWPLSFTTFLTFIVGVHMAGTVLMWASTRATQIKAADVRAANRAARNNGRIEEADPITHVVIKGKSDGNRVPIYGWFICVCSIIPLVGHVVIASSCAASPLCLSSPHHYHESASSLPWASLLLTINAIANPLLYVFSDDQVSSTTLQFLSKICCWWKRDVHRPPMPREPQSNNGPTDVYVTNDTDLLVGDNT